MKGCKGYCLLTTYFFNEFIYAGIVSIRKFNFFSFAYNTLFCSFWLASYSIF